ncbi:hypothetical protein [Mitsuokella multacida]|uniref:hypothetical protein n=1 Tax=Mitsuokella multacida TaxID=52226 RepID=UPI00265B4091|nr:hypothetical protein [Mitsuokella multacida]
MNKNEIHAYLDEVLGEEYARGNRDGYQQGRLEGYRFGRAAVILPHPCDGPLYDDWHWSQQLAKVREEFEEVVSAFDSVQDCTEKHLGMAVFRERRDHLMRECTDLIVATTTFIKMRRKTPSFRHGECQHDGIKHVTCSVGKDLDPWADYGLREDESCKKSI